MSTVSEKLLQVAQNNPKVYHSGQLNIVKNAECLKASESGSALLIDDVSPVTHDMSVKVRGKNLIPYPYYHTTKTVNGITFTDNGDGSITISGKAESDAYFYLCVVDFGSNNMWNETANNNGYYVSGCKHFFYNRSNKISTIVVPSGTDYSTNTITVKPQIELGTTATAYTPYVPDLTAVKVKRQGKNILPLADSGIYYKGSIKGGKPFIANSTYGISDFNNIDISTYRGVYAVIKLTEGETYTLTVNNLVNNCATKQIKLAVGFRSSEDTIFGTSETDTTAVSPNYNPSSWTFTVPSGYPYCLVGFYNYPTVSGDTVSFNAMQLELGSTATDHTPYITPTEYTPTADGTVNGVTSLYPNTTLTTDTNGVLIDCEYYRDIDKTFNELTTSVALSGGDA